MQFSSIITIFTLAIAASAAPVDDIVARTGTPPVNQCSQGLTVQCCDSFTKSLAGLLGVNVGLGCVNVLNIASPQCSNSQKLACCNTGSQTGLVNVGTICPQVL